MKLSKQLVVAALAWALATPAYASEPRVIGWDELAPEPVAYDNPFSALSPEQLKDLRRLLRVQQDGGAGEDAGLDPGTDPGGGDRRLRGPRGPPPAAGRVSG